ncbi:hypothetical protein Rhopal_002047-T1 [Rhodotorula paludigena]|uniref:RING-type domain-containing protein n=1 Tax=Rhodotorula paludigena TaxID=86838 RepID=A0AAV5GFU2_9BASI|nr:hypothetical protein Rhopal_002047-T1 [Rhodotorula paludigena]
MHECRVCFSSKPYAPGKGPEPDWVAVTSCGHVFHNACLQQWYAVSDYNVGCPNRCTLRNVKQDKKPGSRFTEPLPLLRLYIQPAADGAPSSDAPGGDDEKARVKKDVKGKGKARMVVEDDEDDDIADADEESETSSIDGGAAAGPSDEASRLRRQWAAAMDTVRQQRAKISELQRDLDGARAEVEADALDYLGQPYCERCTADNSDDEGLGQMSRKEQIEVLKHELAELRATSVSKVQYDLVTHKLGQLEERCKDAEQWSTELENDFRTAQIEWQQIEKALRDQIEASGEDGRATIKALQHRIRDKDRENLKINGKIDGLEKKVQDAEQLADIRVAKARQDAAAAQADARTQIASAQTQLQQELNVRKRFERANAVLRAQNKKLKAQRQELQAKRGIIASDSEPEEPKIASPPPAGASAKSPLARQRSRNSHSPFGEPANPPPFRINTNSLLLASPSKKRHVRTPMDDCNVSYEEPAVADGALDESDDDLEYVDDPRDGDENVAPSGPADAAPRDRLDDSSSDIEVVESSYFARSAPAGRASASTAGVQRPIPFPSLALGSTAGTAVRPSKKLALSQSRSDKYLPDFTQGLTGSGPKHRVKRR